eukprot:TRINITY_DN6199_c0_g5_i3.p1 TRINITY_DN6199_c0_g5~~TRINITY_DN6199_c0_g5_i3.p1  ORF type:complete len:365 (+),score=53.88 TRINITY_DN6199_c0_g5_i3:132-1226(+)
MPNLIINNMLEIQMPEQIQKYSEVGKFNPQIILVDDSEILKNETCKMAKLVVYEKKFVWGMQIFYADGGSSGIHAGFMEPETPPTAKELILEVGEDIEEIAGYISEYVGALHIRTTLGKTLDAGNLPIGSLFTFVEQGHIIAKVVAGYTGYLSYIGAYMTQCLPIVVPQFQLMNTYSIDPFIKTDASNQAISKAGSTLLRPGVYSEIVEFSEMFGTDCPSAAKFNDYEELVAPILRNGGKIRISRIKLYKDKTGIIGIKPVYTAIDKYGNVAKYERPHRSKAVGFFTSRASIDFSLSNYPKVIEGSYTNLITYLRVVSTNTKTAESGKQQGKKFAMESKANHVIALAGSFSDYLYTLRAYYMAE